MWKDSFTDLCSTTSSFFYLIMMALQFGVITVACSGIGLLLSVYQANFVCGSRNMWTGIYVAVSYIPSRSIFSILGLISMSSTWGSTVSHRIYVFMGGCCIR